MTALLNMIGPSLFRASWQAAMLAFAVVLLVWWLGTRITARWRYLLWSIVVIRLLLLVTPTSPWSAFNVVRWSAEKITRPVAVRETVPAERPEVLAAPDPRPLTSNDRVASTIEQPNHEEPVAQSTAGAMTEPAMGSIRPATLSEPAATPVSRRVNLVAFIVLAGCFVCTLQLIAAGLLLRRRLSACRRVTDVAVLAELDLACRRLGIKKRPGVVVTPESLSPCLVGTWKPKIVLPELLVVQPAGAALRHVLMHELAHLVRKDLWTNWLILLARLLHWFNPIAWWTIREMLVEREAACDEMAVAALGEAERCAYASTLINLAAGLEPAGSAPAMIGVIGSARRVTARIVRLTQVHRAPLIRAPFATALVLGVAIVGLTDSMPTAAANRALANFDAEQGEGQRAEPTTVTLRGRCLDQADRSPVAGAEVRLFKAEGRTRPIVEIAKATSDRDGRFEFPGLAPPGIEEPIERLTYLLLAEAEGRPVGAGMWTGFERETNLVNIAFLREKTMLAGTVQDANGRPVAGATVAHWSFEGRPVPDILSAKTGPNGRFVINRIPYYDWLRPGSTNQSGLTFTITHPAFPQSELEVKELPRNVTITLPVGCRVSGTVVDAVTGRPAAGALILAQRISAYSETPVSTDASGHFDMVLPEDRYNFAVKMKDRMGRAITDQECRAGEKLELPRLTLTAGGLISGRVINASTGKPIALTEEGRPIALGLFGPSDPMGKVISPQRMATVDRDGRFALRAAPGDNFPYLVNYRGDRMGWNTTQQPPVVVKEGDTTAYDMLVTPEIPPAERLKAAQRLVDSLPTEPSKRTAQILLEFRKLGTTVDETELWCTLMRELVAIGRDAVPQICAELDQTTENRTLRRLAFAARAIGDPRAVPALIRAIPRTLLPSSSDYGLIVADPALTDFMQKYDLDQGRGGTHFGFGRPEREVIGALEKLTGQRFDDSEIFGLHRSDDARRQALQRRLFTRHARRWQTWWEAHSREFTGDSQYREVGLKPDDEPLPPAINQLRPNARLEGGFIGATLSPASEGGGHTEYFYDLDTGGCPRWPASLPKVDARTDPIALDAWAAESGADLMCVSYPALDGKRTFVLRALHMKVWEISPRDLRNFEKLIAAGTLPQGPDVGELLMHQDAESKRPIPDANGAFVFVTREGSMGLIEVTDRVTQTADLTGGVGMPPAGVGFHRGVRFNLRMIVP